MMTKKLSKTLMAASLVVALGAAGVAPAMASGAAIQSDADTSMSTKVSDSWITTKVKSEFATTKGVSATHTSVDTKDGVVMLSGTVGSQAQKQMAITSARSVKGVKAVQADALMVDTNDDSMKSGSMKNDSMNHDAMDHGSMSSDHDDSMSSGTSLATKTSDTWITTKVKSNFATTDGVDVTDVSVDTKSGVVMLSGTVGSRAEKQMAIKSARSIEGVKAVQADKLMIGNDGDSMKSHSMKSDSMKADSMNHGAMNHDAMNHDANDSMSSDTSLATKASDTWITTKVKSNFATTEGVDVTDVSVDTKAGVVMLSGTVGSRAEKQMAIKSARSIKGVKAVQADKLMIGNDGDSMKSDSMKSGSMNHGSMSNDTNDSMSSDTSLATKVSDTWITTKVKSDFATTEGVDVTDISVDTKAGVVMLGGTVGSEAEKQMAIKSARSVEGVKAVEAGNLAVGNN